MKKKVEEPSRFVKLTKHELYQQILNDLGQRAVTFRGSDRDREEKHGKKIRW